MKTDTPETPHRTAACPAPEDLVAALLDAESTDAAGRKRRHAEACPHCRLLAGQTRRTVASLERWTGPADARDLVSAVLEGIPERAWRPPRDARRVARVAPIPGFGPAWRMAAGLLLLLAAGVLFWKGLSRSPADRGRETESVAAVDRGVHWLLVRQKPGGGWDAAALGGRAEYAPALTGLAVLALCRAGEGAAPEPARLERAAQFLVSCQEAGGRFGADFDGAAYNHGIATLAVLNVYAATRRETLREPLEDALAYLLAQQSPSGGWGYGGPDHSQPNTSITVWQVQALLLADRLGWARCRVPLRRGLAWLAGNVDRGGHFGYERVHDYPRGPATLTMMGAHCMLAARQLDIPVDPALLDRVARGLTELAEVRPNDYYGSYFYASALSKADRHAFGDKLAAARSSLLDSQRMAGVEVGTWLADDRWGNAGGNLYSTAMALLSLTAPGGVALR